MTYINYSFSFSLSPQQPFSVLHVHAERLFTSPIHFDSPIKKNGRKEIKIRLNFNKEKSSGERVLGDGSNETEKCLERNID